MFFWIESGTAILKLSRYDSTYQALERNRNGIDPGDRKFSSITRNFSFLNSSYFDGDPVSSNGFSIWSLFRKYRRNREYLYENILVWKYIQKFSKTFSSTEQSQSRKNRSWNLYLLNILKNKFVSMQDVPNCTKENMSPSTFTCRRALGFHSWYTRYSFYKGSQTFY